jgi:hypothetical protein
LIRNAGAAENEMRSRRVQSERSLTYPLIRQGAKSF